VRSRDPDGVAGQRLEGLDGEDEAEEDVFPPVDELYVHRGEPVEHQVEQPLVERRGLEQGRGGSHAREDGLGDD
jgi:hypothetical protein